MITKNFQKLGALVASLVGILTLSSAAEAITFTSAGGGTIGRATGAVGAPATRTYQLIPGPAETGSIANFNSVTISNLLFGSKKDLKATLIYSFSSPDPDITATRSITLFNRDTSLTAPVARLNGKYTFVSSGGLDWATASNAVGSNAVSSGRYNSVDDFSVFEDAVSDPSFLNATWSLQIQNFATSSPQGSFSSFSIDASPVPFESNAAPAGVAIVFGALMLRRKLQQRSAQKMSLESVNS